MHADFEARGHHAERIVHAGLLVENEFLWKQMQDFAVGRQGKGAGFVDGLANFFACDFTRTRPNAMPPCAVHARGRASRPTPTTRARPAAPAVSSARFDCFLNRSDCFLQINNHALARTARLSDAVTAIAQTVFREFGHQAQVLALPTSITLMKFPCWFGIFMGGPVDRDFLRRQRSGFFLPEQVCASVGRQTSAGALGGRLRRTVPALRISLLASTAFAGAFFAVGFGFVL